ncbi:MAG: serine hydrolase [Eubacteriales bacterium]|nr:serine hydrolase [Eubacteriales bacterium]
MRDFESEEALRQARREKRRAELRRQRMRRQRQRRAAAICAVLLCAAMLAAGGRLIAGRQDAGEQTAGGQENGLTAEGETEAAVPARENGSDDGEIAGEESASAQESGETDDVPDEEETEASARAEALPFAAGYTAQATDATAWVAGGVQSTYALLIDLDDSTIVAQKNAKDRISPASMTKILTVLVAAEHVTDLDDTFTITREITDYSYANDCSAVGFGENETVTVRDLLYGTILPSGADAAAGLAYYVSGSLDGFVELMNQKLQELGLSETAHFTNCVGLYAEEHYCTAYDMAMILKAAVENELCREILSARTYTTSATGQHPEGIQISNWFLRRIEDKETGGDVVCAKTGYVAQSGSCAASYQETDSGKHYICVTADAHSSWRCIYDHVEIYSTYTE